jgi:hypothetical protein
MNARVEIDAGVCGFRTRAVVYSEDDQNVSYDISSDCEKILGLSKAVANLGLIDAYKEISPAGESNLLACCRETLKGCCSGCVVPVGLFKAMQVAAGLALPKDVRIILSK